MKKTSFWVILIGGMLVVSLLAAFLLSGRGDGTTAQIWLDGELLETVNLEVVTSAYSFSLEAHGGYNLVEVEHGRIRVAKADCPDQVCVRQGWISTRAAPVVCLPHNLVIEIVGGEGDADTVVQ